MMRRPHEIALNHGFGLFNDAFGHASQRLTDFCNGTPTVINLGLLKMINLLCRTSGNQHLAAANLHLMETI